LDLYILRHAEAGKRVAPSTKDAERSLTAEGFEELEAVAKALARLRVEPDHIVTSPLNRAKETAVEVAKALKGKKKVELWDELKPEGDRHAFFKRLSKFGPETVILVVGHEPYLTTAISEVMGHSGPPHIVLRKCGLARLSIRSFVPKLDGELRWLLTPKLLKRI
jgi:phosphohistidine phosphatase